MLGIFGVGILVAGTMTLFRKRHVLLVLGLFMLLGLLFRLVK
jgi:hypothetical protein